MSSGCIDWRLGAGGAGKLLAAALLVWGSVASAAWTGDLPEPKGDVVLRVTGNIEQVNAPDEARLDRRLIEALPQHKLETTTVVTDGVNVFEGFLVRDLLEALGAHGETVTATALNDYVIDIPYSDFERFDVLAAHSMDGERLTPQDKGPLWIVYPRDDHTELQDIRYDYRWVWQLVRLDIQ
jgi:hypothetical protein